MNLWTTATGTKISEHKKDFNSNNYTAFMKKAGGFEIYVRSLGGIFAQFLPLLGKTCRTLSQFRLGVQFVMGLMAIYKFCYWNGSVWWFWLNSASKAFYSSKETAHCRGGSITQLCTGADGRTRITNCNYGVDTLLRAIGWYKWACTDKKWLSNGGRKITKKSALKPGDVIHFYRKSDGKWHHVVIVYAVEGGKIWCADFGNRFIKTGVPLHYMPVDDSTAAGGEYGTDKWVGWHLFDLEDDTMPREKTTADRAVELRRDIESYLAAKRKEYGEEVYALAQNYKTNRDQYLRAAADYVFEDYAGKGEAREVFFGEDYSDIQAKVNWVWRTALEVLEDKYGSGEERKQALGDEWQVVQNEVNRLKKAGY